MAHDINTTTSMLIILIINSISPLIAAQNLGSDCLYDDIVFPCSTIPGQNDWLDVGCNHGQGSYSHKSEYHSNLLTVFSNLTTAASSHAFYESTMAGLSHNKVYGSFYCRADVDPSVCQGCVLSSAAALKECSAKEGIIYYRECTLHYANYPMTVFNVTNEYELAFPFCDEVPETPDRRGLNRTVVGSMGKLIDRLMSANSSYFATEVDYLYANQNQKVYTLVQCAPERSRSECGVCLRVALEYVMRIGCLSTGVTWGMFRMPSCQLRYDLVPFYNLPSSPAPANPLPRARAQLGSTTNSSNSTSPGITGSVRLLCTLAALSLSLNQVNCLSLSH